jgi:pyruvate/2-oxoglutarate dehydrogenase complex dihydrolipoamide dehydrogenase (E3) component
VVGPGPGPTVQRPYESDNFMSQEQVDILILGSGQGGKLLAWDMARSGRRTVVIERRWIGGSCPNIACLPSKNEIWSARVAHLAHHAGQFGTVAGPVETDMAAVRQRKSDMVRRGVEHHLDTYRATGAELVMGSGRFVAPKTIEVNLNDGGTRLFTGSKVFLNTGTHAAVPSVTGLEAARPLTHIEALELDYLPSHLIVLGGGYVGLEMAQAYRRFGSRVTVIERTPRILGREDPDVAEELQCILGSGSMQFVLEAEVTRVRGRSGDDVSVSMRTPSGEQIVEGSDILVAAGRVPNTEGIGLEKAGVELDVRGYIRVNDRLETTAPDVWALGECAGSPQFTHASVDDFRVIRDNLAGGNRSTRDRLVPYCVFSDPPLAHVGLSEGEARAQGIAVRIGRMPTSNVLRTDATDETRGFMKVLVGSDDRILGFTMIGSEAGEVMTVIQAAMLGGLLYQRMRDAVIAHPTMAEGLGQLLSQVLPTRTTGV